MTELFPGEIVAGVSLSHAITVLSRPAPDWALTAYLRGPMSIDLAAAGDGARHLLEADAATTALWAPGDYSWALRAASSESVEQLARGRLKIVPDLAQQAAGFEDRSHAERVLASIEAVIEGRATRDQQSYTIGNRTLQRTPLADLMKLRDRYRAEVARERAAANGGGFGRRHLVRFT